MRETTVEVGGVELYVVEDGEDTGGPLVVLCHGFPELAWSWRHQIPVLAEAGYHVIAADGRGYGRSAAPPAVEDYDILALTGDIVGLIDAFGHERAVVVGHDWGSVAVWQTALMHPDRVTGVVGMSVPFIPRGERPPIQVMRHLFGDGFFYILYFQEPGVADADLAADPRRFLTRIMAGLGSARGGDPSAAARMFAAGPMGFVDRLPEPDGLPDWLSEAELDRYVAEFERTGFTGGLNWYRNMDRNWHLTESLAGAKVAPPARFIGGAEDPVLAMMPVSSQDGHLLDDRGTVIIPGAGHWVQQEKPAEVNAALIEFLSGLEKSGSSGSSG